MNPHTRSAPAAESASTAVLLPPIYLRTHMPLWKTHRSHIGTADLLPAKASHIPVSSYNLSFLPSFPGLTGQESFSLFYQLSQVSATGKQRFPLFPRLNIPFLNEQTFSHRLVLSMSAGVSSGKRVPRLASFCIRNPQAGESFFQSVPPGTPVKSNEWQKR